MHESTIRDKNCLVVYRDTPERIIQEDMLHCFAEMYARPLYLIRDVPEESCCDLTKDEIRQVLMMNPKDRSIWLRDDSGVFILVSDESTDLSGKNFLADFYQSEILKRITALTTMLQYIGVKSYEVHANEEVADSGTHTESKSGSFKIDCGVTGVSADASVAAQKARAFSQKINRGFKFSQAAHRNASQIDIKSLSQRIAERGLAGIHVLETLLQSIRDGEDNWGALEVEESLAADICTSTTNKLDAAAQIAVKFAIRNGEGDAKRHLNMETSKRMMQSLEIHISNR